jgi:hypothetical protein
MNSCPMAPQAAPARRPARSGPGPTAGPGPRDLDLTVVPAPTDLRRRLEVETQLRPPGPRRVGHHYGRPGGGHWALESSPWRGTGLCQWPFPAAMTLAMSLAARSPGLNLPWLMVAVGGGRALVSRSELLDQRGRLQTVQSVSCHGIQPFGCDYDRKSGADDRRVSSRDRICNPELLAQRAPAAGLAAEQRQRLLR